MSNTDREREKGVREGDRNRRGTERRKRHKEAQEESQGETGSP